MAKKEKITYIDDGRTIADMSGVGHSGPSFSKTGTSSPLREIWRTYWNATKMMLLPTLAICAGIGILYLLVYLFFLLAY